jgi:hypothetical protein
LTLPIPVTYLKIGFSKTYVAEGGYAKADARTYA